MTWLGTRRGLLWTGGIAAVLFLVRAFLDFRYVYPEFTAPDDLATNGIAFAVYGLVSGAWIWSLIGVAGERRGGAIGVAVLSVVCLALLWVATAVVFCPFPCQSQFPLGEAVNTSGFVAGILALLAALRRLRAG